MRTALLLSLVVATLASAQPMQFAPPVPLTATRYGTQRGQLPLLLSSGGAPLLFWSDGRFVQVATSRNGVFDVSRAVLRADGIDAIFDAVWTGTHFLVVAAKHVGAADVVVGRRLDANGAPIGDEFEIAEGRHPRIAFVGEHALLLFVPRFTTVVAAFLLHPDGRPAEPAPRSLGITQSGRVALTSNGSSFAAVIPRPLEPRLVIFDALGRVTAETAIGPYGASAAIATDGRRYLAVLGCGDGACGPLTARLVEPNGTLSPPLELDVPLPLAPSAVWTGSKWVFAYMREQAESSTAHVVTIDADATTIENREESIGGETSLAYIGGRLVRATVGARRPREPIAVDGVPASIAPKRQFLLATATSNDATLVLWQESGNEQTTLHTGVRDLNGRWLERQIHTLPPTPWEELLFGQAASDGHGFLIVTSGSEGRFAQRLDALGEPAGPRERVPNDAGDTLLWTGAEYRLVGREIDRRIGNRARFASNGNGEVFAAWRMEGFVNHAPTTFGIGTLRVGEPQTATIPTDSALDHETAWDGARYVVAWASSGGVLFTREGELAPRRITTAIANDVALTPIASGVAMHFLLLDGPHRLVYLRRDGTTSAPITLSDDRRPAQLAALPDGGVAFLQAVDDRILIRLPAYRRRAV